MRETEILNNNAHQSPPVGDLGGCGFIQLHPKDNVVVALKDLQAGETIDFNKQKILLLNNIPFGHKLAIQTIAAGEKVLKYGLPIGSATQNIAIGEHVHTQNLQTDYTTKTLKSLRSLRSLKSLKNLPNQ
jgi:altronate hydrolase